MNVRELIAELLVRSPKGNEEVVIRCEATSTATHPLLTISHDNDLLILTPADRDIWIKQP